MPPWQLPCVHSPAQKSSSHPLNLTIEQLQSYQKEYPYMLQLPRQLQQPQQLLPPGMIIGRPISAGSNVDYTPLLQHQLNMQQRQLLRPDDGDKQSSEQEQQLHSWHDDQPWHHGMRSADHDTRRWVDKRSHWRASPSQECAGSSSDRPSTADACAESQASGAETGQSWRQHRQQQQHARSQHSRWWPWAGSMQQRQQQKDAPRQQQLMFAGNTACEGLLPRFRNETLPHELLMLITPVGCKAQRSMLQ
jgi:hypothetical protein